MKIKPSVLFCVICEKKLTQHIEKPAVLICVIGEKKTHTPIDKAICANLCNP